MEIFANFLFLGSFLGDFGVILGFLRSTKKVPKYPQIQIARTLGNTLKFEYKFGAWRTL